ncbi:MAG TPA: hypothetical protein VFS67_13500 [Polyangiaceae bacterium]|nr:hypothetical protein [Polyangiaceae bacterium]
MPDYDGREAPTSVGEALLWGPRVLLYPLYLVSEYVLRRPLGWLVSTAEREHWPTLIINFFTFGERQGGIVPTWLIDYGLRPSFGVYAFWNDFLVADNDLRLRVAYGGTDLWQARLTDRFPVGSGTLSLTGLYDARPDNVYYGLGPNQEDAGSRYYRRQTRAFAVLQLPWVRSSGLRFGLGVREVELDGSVRCCGDPSLDEQVQAGAYPLPPGMDQVFGVFDQAVELVLDSRWPLLPENLELASDYVSPPRTGVRWALRADLAELTGQSLAIREGLAGAWLHYGTSLGGYWDVTGQQRTLGLTAIVDFVDPLGSGAVPLTDLVTLGGERPLQGYLANRLFGRSSAALRLEYRWPVAVWLDGELLYEMGNVFGAGLSGFELGQLRSSFGFGLSAVGQQDHRFQLLLALGISPYEAGAQVDSLRFVLGTTAGF